MPTTIPPKTQTEELLYGDGPAWLTLGQVAQVLGLSERAAQAAASAGKLWGLPVEQPSGPRGTRRVPRAAVRELVEGWRREREGQSA
ncbi:MAG: hypothetical protein M3Y91_15845 [Actinomycetota bacterium]|nr:hypothetical protein [Actinomycetota bacterium]